MALVSADYIKPRRALGLNAIPQLEVLKAAGTAVNMGDIIIASSGLAIVASDGPTTGTVIGVAIEATAASAKTTVAVCPALPNMLFEAHIATGDSGATASLANSQLWVGYGLALNSSIWYVNVGDTSDKQVRIVDLIDAASTAWGAVEIVFMDSVWNNAT